MATTRRNATVKNFALTGVAGYVAPRHLKAIQDTGHRLVAALDPFDSVGVLDSYFPDCAFFTEYERFDRHLEKLRRRSDEDRVHMVSVCAPNHLHDAHVRTALRVGADALCEKPLVLNPWNLDALAEIEAETERRVWTVLQLRVHPALVALKKRLEAEPRDRKHQVVLTYVTARGAWYQRSWKGVAEKSGGVGTNIGVHFFDLLHWLFGPMGRLETHVLDDRTCAGAMELERADVQWFLSINAVDVPERRLAEGERTFRSIEMDGEEIEFSGGFTDLHTEVYRRTLAGNGFGIEDARAAIEIVHAIRTTPPTGAGTSAHPLLRGRSR
jgi:UDP-N-acetyl-2-amino-2-deoxyglucuronate dehydrogenase